MSARVWRRRRHAGRVRRALARADRQTDLTVAWARRYTDARLDAGSVALLRWSFRAIAVRDEQARMHAR